MLWFILKATILMALIVDNYLNLSECLGIIRLYVAIVCFAVFRAKYHQSKRSAAEIHDVQCHEGHGERSENEAGLPDQTTPNFGC